MRKHFLAFGIFLSLAMGFNAFAGKPNARQLYRQGNRLFDKGKFEAASQKFREAYDAKPHWKIRYNIGQSEAAAKHYGKALEQFEAYLVEAGDELSVEREEMVSKEIRRLKTKVGALNIDAPNGASVWIDGEQRGMTPLLGKLRVNAGVSHKLEIRLNDELLLSRDFRLGSEEVFDIRVEEDSPNVGVAETEGPEQTAAEGEKENAEDGAESTEPRDDAAPLGTVGSSKPNNKLKIAGWSLIGVGGATLIGGAVTGALAISKNNELKENCDEDTYACEPQFENTGDQVTRMSTLSTVFFSAGAALAATGLVLLIVHKKKQESAVAVTPVMMPAFSGIVVEGRF